MQSIYDNQSQRLFTVWQVSHREIAEIAREVIALVGNDGENRRGGHWTVQKWTITQLVEEADNDEMD